VSSGGADAYDVFLAARAGEYTRFAGDRIHQPQDITEVQVMVRAIVDGHAARVATSGLAGLPAAARDAARMATRLAAAAGRPGNTRVAEAGESEESLLDASTESFDASARVALVRRTMKAGGEAAGMFGRALTQLVVATSTGVLRSTLATEAYGAFTIESGDGTAHFVDLGRAADRLGLPAAIETTAAQAAASRGRTELAPGRYTVVLGPEATAELIEFLPAFGFSGELAAAGIGITTRTGEKLAAPLVSIADDAHAPVGLPIGFDLEGVAKRRVTLFDNGVVGGPVTDLATAAALGVWSSGHAHIAREEPPATRAANLVMAAGDQDEATLIAGVDHGVYIQRFWYTRLVDRTAGTITGVTRDACFEITGGTLGRPVTGMRFTQSVLDLLSTVDGAGDRQRTVPMMNVWNGAASAPAIRAHGFRLGAR
jgi:predicted Zn-dependent protease